MSSQAQTLSFLIRRFKEVGIRPHKRLGQNFLIDLNLLRLLASTAQLGPEDVVLETGTGTGSLTALMAQQAAAVITVELDPQLFELASEELHTLENVHMLNVDVLERKNRLNADMLAAVEAQLAAGAGRRFKVVANLPYNVATPILTNLLTLDRPPESMTVTIQKELADRIVAQPSTKEYGALSIWIQSQCRAEIVRVMPPSVFWPRPKVSSAIMRIALDEERRGRIADRAFFHRFVRAMFLHRRKFLRSQLAAAESRLGKSDVKEVLAQLGLDASARAEQLDVETMLALAEAARLRCQG